MNCQLGFFIAEAERTVPWFFFFYILLLLTTKECYRLIVQGSKCNNMHELDWWPPIFFISKINLPQPMSVHEEISSFAHLTLMVCSKDTRIILVRIERSYVQSVAARVTGTVCSRGYRWTREGADPKSLVEGLKSAESLFSCSAVCSCLCCVPPFIKEGEDAGHIRKREERERGRESRRRSPLGPPPVA